MSEVHARRPVDGGAPGRPGDPVPPTADKGPKELWTGRDADGGFVFLIAWSILLVLCGIPAWVVLRRR